MVDTNGYHPVTLGGLAMTEQTRRSTRLIEIESLLRRNPRGLTVREIAERKDYSTRTIQRDINALESELGVPLIELPGRRWGILAGSSPIGSVRFSLHEARAVYLAVRLFLRHADEQDPDGITALDKLAGAVPLTLADHVEETVKHLRRRPVDERATSVLHTVTEGWANGRSVLITYRSVTAEAPRDLLIDPYILEPSATGAATYVIGYSHEHAAIRTFKCDRILAAEATDTTFEPEGLPELRERLARAWGGVVLGDDQFQVVLEFSADVADRVMETHWHETEITERLPDGRLRFQVVLPSLLEFVPWVRGWGSEVTVIEPPELRDEVATSLRKAAALYGD
jgi:proteasome accessory factor B